MVDRRRDGQAKLGDFGLALAADRTRLSLEGMIVGTVAYMPPEQALGRTPDARSDLYALGAMLYEMVTGRPPFLGDDAVTIISQHLNTPPVAPSWHNAEVPRAFEALILKLMAKAPDARLQSAGAVREVLGTISSAEPAPAGSPSAEEMNPLDRLAGGVFVGREQVMTELRAIVEQALSGRARLVMLVGEPGIGKTRTAAELATYAQLRKAQVLWGRCYEGDGAPAYWPWVQVIRSYVHERDTKEWASEMGSGAADIGQVVSEVREQLPGLPPPPSLDPEQARFRFFDSIATFLQNVTRRQPLVLVLDDLHWADKPSLLLLQFLGRHVSEARLLIIGTYRDVDLGRQHPLVQALGELVREDLTQRVLLRGLMPADVGRYVEMTTGYKPHDSLVAAVYRETEGNPFFVGEVVRLLATDHRLEQAEDASSWSLTIPQGVREVVGRRLDRLSAECNRVLTIASVIGRDFALDGLQQVSDVPGEQLLDLLEEAVAAHVIGEVATSPRHYSFSHTLIRETLYAELSAGRRIALHRRVATALETLHSKKVEPHLAELAHHFLEAAHGGGDVDRAVVYCRRAGDWARLLLAYEDAAGHYLRALEALELKEPGVTPQRCELLLLLGEAQGAAGDRQEAKETFQDAAAVARALEAREQLARAALGVGRFGFFGVEVGVFDPSVVELLEEALEALHEEDGVLRARVLANLSIALYWSPSRERRARLSEKAVEMARRLDDPATLAAALVSMYWALFGPEQTEKQLRAANEIVQLAEQVGDVETALQGRVSGMGALLELGDIQAVDREIAFYARRAEELRQPRYRTFAVQWRAMRAVLDGRFAEAEELILQAMSMSQNRGDPAVSQSLGMQMFAVYGVKGRLGELEPAIKAFLDQYPAIPGWRSVLAHTYSEMGREAEARIEFERLAARDFGDLPEDITWLFVLASLASTCAFLRDARRASVLYRMLRPYADRCVVLSATLCTGSAARLLGLLATTMGRFDEAQQHFEAALAMNARIGATPWLAQTQHDYADMLLRRGAPGDRERALVLVSRALETAQALGMKVLLERGLALKLRAQRGVAPDHARAIEPSRVATVGDQAPGRRRTSLTRPSRTATSTATATSAERGNVFRREGEYWTLAYQGSLVRLKDAKGLHYIAHLLRHPGQQFHSRGLAAGPASAGPAEERSARQVRRAGLGQEHVVAASLGGTGPVLDARAKAEYKRRLTELRQELAQAEEFNDLGRAARAREEMELFGDQLKAAVGLGGRDRKIGSHSERARLLVRQSIKSALKKIAACHPPLGDHLSASIKTGYYCSYAPEPGRAVEWVF